jgi:hypothetical protein
VFNGEEELFEFFTSGRAAELASASRARRGGLRAVTYSAMTTEVLKGEGN